MSIAYSLTLTQAHFQVFVVLPALERSSNLGPQFFVRPPTVLLQGLFFMGSTHLAGLSLRN